MIKKLNAYYEYDPRLLTLAPMAVHVGVLNLSVENRLLALEPGVQRILCCEASERNYQGLLRANPNGRIAVRRVCLWKENGTAVLNLMRAGSANSVFTPDEKHLAWRYGSEPVPAKTLQSILDDEGIECVGLLLLNCEGGEVFALEQLAANEALSSCVLQVSTAWHYKHSVLYSDERRQALIAGMGARYDHHPNPDSRIYEYALFRLRSELEKLGDKAELSQPSLRFIG